MKPKSGFTLIEVLTALGILALVAVLSFRGLAALLAAESQLTDDAKRWQRIESFIATFENDFRYAAPRSGRDPAGRLQPAIQGNAELHTDDDAHLSLTRFPVSGNANPVSLQRVGFRFSPPEVRLLVWPNLDAAPRDQAEQLVVLEGLTAASLRYRDKVGLWHGSWPANGRADELPSAVELVLELKGIGRITRLINR